jgi:hypothetical protein
MTEDSKHHRDLHYDGNGTEYSLNLAKNGLIVRSGDGNGHKGKSAFC